MHQRCSLTVSCLALALVTLVAHAASAQQQSFNIFLPQASPRAAVSQTVGVTNIEINYHRPAVKGRKIWGALVPYGEVWRVGANENTLISFSTDVQVNGKPLAAGTYGLHAIPGETDWQIIFSHDTTAWGSFSYDRTRDALRVTASPEEAPFRERMILTFDDVTDDAATVSIRWEKLRVPFNIRVDSKATTLESIHNQLKGLPQYFWRGWNQAATWALQNETAYEEALGWTDRSIQIEERFENLSTKAQLLERTGKPEAAANLIERALPKGNPGQIYNYARQLVRQDRKDDALKIFQKNADLHPDSWITFYGLGQGYSGVGDFEKALASMQRAYELAPDSRKAFIQSRLDRLRKKEDIN